MSADPHNQNAVGSRKKEPLHTGENIEMLFKKKRKKLVVASHSYKEENMFIWQEWRRNFKYQADIWFKSER